MWASDDKIFFLFPYYDIVHSNVVPGEFTCIFEVKQIGMITKELKNEKLYF